VIIPADNNIPATTEAGLLKRYKVPQNHLF